MIGLGKYHDGPHQLFTSPQQLWWQRGFSRLNVRKEKISAAFLRSISTLCLGVTVDYNRNAWPLTYSFSNPVNLHVLAFIQISRIIRFINLFYSLGMQSKFWISARIDNSPFYICAQNFSCSSGKHTRSFNQFWHFLSSHFRNFIIGKHDI